MFCQQCGKEINNDYGICESCGKTSDPPRQASSQSGWPGWVVGLIIVISLFIPIVGLVAGAIAVSKPESISAGTIILVLSILFFIVNVISLINNYNAYLKLMNQTW
jgi:CBS domain containing-hemolysin-like protein